MKKILVTGATGQLGSELAVISKDYPHYDWIFANRTVVSLDNLSLLSKQLDDLNPNIIINTAAYTAVDKAEAEQSVADVINHQAIGVIANWSQKNNTQLIHLSTDYVFAGTSSIALDEQAITDPINVYGKTKLLGEERCLINNPLAIVIRTSWVYSSFGNNFVKTMLRLMKERESISVVQDQIGSPTYAADLAEAIMNILENKQWTSGIYHFANSGVVSWYDFALAIKDLSNLNCEVKGIPSSSYPTAARRPFYSLLDTGKVIDTFGVRVPDYRVSLKKCIDLLQANS